MSIWRVAIYTYLNNVYTRIIKLFGNMFVYQITIRHSVYIPDVSIF